jgi:transcriptional regulator with XRE-family HTH domain
MGSELAKRLTEAIDRRSWTRAQLAEAVGASQPAVSTWCTGKKRPSHDNIVRLAKALGVAASWLEYGDGGRDDGSSNPDADRTAYREALRWYWRPLPPDHGREHGSPAAFAFEPNLDTPARETGQNGNDARLPGEPTVELVYTAIELVGDDLEAFLDVIQYEEELRPHFLAASQGTQKVAEAVRAGLERLEREQRLLLIRVDDYHTTGLIGPEFDSGPFMAVARNVLDSNKRDATAGGSYGLGKAAMWAASSLRLVLMDSMLSEPIDGLREHRFIGRLELPWHEVDEEPWAGPAWFGEWDSDCQCTRSYWGNPTLARDLHLDRDRPASGTSFLIVGAYDPSGETEGLEAVAKALRRAMAKSFWPAMVPRSSGEPPRLRVTVRAMRGRTKVSEHVVDPTEFVSPMVAALRKHFDGEVVEALERPGDVVRRQVRLKVPKRTGPESHAAIEHTATVLIALADDADEGRNNVAQFRGNHMVIRDDRLTVLPLGARPFHAIVLAGEASGGGSEDRYAERFLRAAEPPAHNRWTATDEVTTQYARGARAALEDFEKGVRAAIHDVVGRQQADLSDGPESLKRLLRLVPPSATTSRPRVKDVRGSLDEDGAWRVKVEVSVPPREQSWQFEPVLRFGTESGPSIPVRWKRLTSKSDGCTVEDRLLRCAPRVRAVEFEAISDPDSHPVGAARARVSVDLRDVRAEEV